MKGPLNHNNTVTILRSIFFYIYEGPSNAYLIFDKIIEVTITITKQAYSLK
jgi:hypothetical protein